jgi:peptide/nickel transport system permease protein
MRFVVRRLGFFVVTLWAAVTANFLIPRLMPGNPALAMMARYPGRINPSALHALEVAFGVKTHASLLSAYFTYLGNVARGRFGTSFTFFPDPVMHDVLQALPWTLVLVGVTTILAFVLGTLIGLVAAWKRGGVLDGVLPPFFVITSAFPYFWLALLAIWLFAIKLGWLPQSGGYDVTGDTVGWSWHFVGDAFTHAVLPALTILITSIGGWILTMRNNTISVLAEDYVRMARAKGLGPWRVMWTYAGRNAILPNLTGFAMSLGFVVSGAILVEYVFNYPGVGWMFLQSVQNQDYALMQGLFLMIVVAVLTAILAADAATAILDPRTRDVR